MQIDVVDLTLGMPKVIIVLLFQSVTRKLTEGENIRELAKYISAYMSLALLSKEGEVRKIDHHKKSRGRSYISYIN